MDTPATLARDLIADRGRIGALVLVATQIVAARSWREAGNVGVLLWAVMRA